MENNDFCLGGIMLKSATAEIACLFVSMFLLFSKLSRPDKEEWSISIIALHETISYFTLNIFR